MSREEGYGGLDYFRIPAAFLVVAIHTSPLTSFSPEADFFLTRILARIAVPFFFMVTGQFLLSDIIPDKDDMKGYGKNDLYHRSVQDKVLCYLKKILVVYTAASVIYVPISIYAGQYTNINIWGVVRRIVFDGTFYHLWYFPAVIIGIIIILLLRNIFKCSKKQMIIIVAILYLFGLAGDSYYGIAARTPYLRWFIQLGFHIWSYTRNGLFFAPIFLLLGALIGTAVKTHTRTMTKSIVMKMIITFAFMAIEAFTLRHYHLQRHDSMYLMLPFLMYYLYTLLLRISAKVQKAMRILSMWIYILHPCAIILIRLISRRLKLPILIDNSLCYYLEVSALSFSWAWLLAILKSWSRSRIGSLRSNQNTEGRAWIELDKKALKNNIRFLHSLLPNGCCLMPAVKANAYGHGDVLVARECQKQGIHFFCVACVSEGVRLRRGGIKGEILILGYTSPYDFHLLYKHNLTQTIADFSYAKNLEESGLKIHVHIGIDTGMHRLGIPWDDKQSIVKVLKMKHLIVDGMYTHLSSSDSLTEEAEIFTRKQVERFGELKSYLRKEGLFCPNCHIQASYGLLNYPEYCEDYIRVGIALYGLLSTREDTERWRDKLSPVLSLKCRIASIREVKAGESIGYGMDYKAPVIMKIAVLTIGYADGVPRALSNGVGAVLIAGDKVPVVGRICMDQMMVDVSSISGVRAGDEAVLIGKTETDDLEISACDWAEWTGGITNEVFSRLGERLGREVV